MGVYDTLIDGDRRVQVKCFTNALTSYEVGDEVPIKGTYIIVLPEREDVRFALVKDGIFIGLTGCPPNFIDKWGGQLSGVADFRDHYEELVRSLSEEEREREEQLR